MMEILAGERLCPSCGEVQQASRTVCRECAYNFQIARCGRVGCDDPLAHMSGYCLKHQASDYDPREKAAYTQAQLDAAVAAAVKAERESRFDLVSHLLRQREWSARTFGPGLRTQGVIEHIRKELEEILTAPTDLEEWIDVVILALDGAWRMGASPEQIIVQVVAKQTKNESREWPDWRTATEAQPIEHIRARAAREEKP